MSTAEEGTADPEAETSGADEPGEPGGMNERTARVILAVVALGAAWGLVAAFPWIAYVIVGVLGTLGWQKVTAWREGRREHDAGSAGEEAEWDDADIVLALHRLAAPHVFLSALAADLDLSKEATRAWLEELHITVRRAVRVGSTTGVGVHKDDIPPLPRPCSDTPVDGVDLQQQHNQHDVTVEEIGLAGVVVKDGSEARRRHRLPRQGPRTSS